MGGGCKLSALEVRGGGGREGGGSGSWAPDASLTDIGVGGDREHPLSNAHGRGEGGDHERPLLVLR